MPIRIGFDMDGVLADFQSAYQEVETRLFGAAASPRAAEPEQEDEAETRAEGDRQEPEAASSPRSEEVWLPAASPGSGKRDEPIGRAIALERDAAPEEERAAKKTDEGATEIPSARQLRRRHDEIWAAIRTTPDFWRSLMPCDDGAVTRIHKLMLQHDWEVFFITQRPITQGETVQRQTQHWLVEQGFDLPSVLVLSGSRGAAAAALRLDYHVDDNLQHCVDVISESGARPLLIVSEDDPVQIAKAKKLGIATASSISECLDLLELAMIARTQPGLLGRLAALFGRK